MGNFLDYIKEDIGAKKLLLSSMPTRTKVNIRKYNEKLEELERTYDGYLDNIAKYIEVKATKLELKDNVDSSIYLKKINDMEKKLKFLNPNNTFIEKLEIDTLLFKLRNQQYFNFTHLNDVIDELISKFKLAGVKLTKDDFNYTPYVKEYMNTFYEIKNANINNYELLTSVFEKIYWKNPDLILHIELNIRKLLRDNTKNFEDYVKRQVTHITNTTNHNYISLEAELKKIYLDLKIENRENIIDIINLAKEGSINVDEMFEDSKRRVDAIDNLRGPKVKDDDLSTFHYNLSNLRANLEEFSSFQKFNDLIIHFNNNYTKLNEEETSKKLKDLEDKIVKEESALYKINRRANSRNTITRKETAFNSITKANEIKELYNEYIKEYFNEKVSIAMRTSFNVNDLLKLYNSFDYYKKENLRKVYNLEDYDEIRAHSDNFSLFASNLANVIRTPLIEYNLNTISNIISNKYSLLNINIEPEDIEEGAIDNFIENLNLTLRVKVIEESKIDIETLWFIKEASNIKNNN